MQYHPYMGRRAMLQRAILLVAGTSVLAGSPGLAATTKAAGKGLSKGQFDICSAVADSIVPTTDTPGAVDAGVPVLLDGMLRKWASPERRIALTGALDTIDTLARAQKNKGFAELPVAERSEFLKLHDAMALKPVPRTDGKSGIAAMLGDPSVADPGYAKLKELIVTLYYYSEPALTSELSYEHAPGQWQPSIPVTPDTRPAGGPGLI